jgi:hypothetical protein
VYLDIQNYLVLKVPTKHIPTQNGESKVLCNKFHRRVNLIALLFNDWGQDTKLRAQNLEIWKSSFHTKSEV